MPFISTRVVWSIATMVYQLALVVDMWLPSVVIVTNHSVVNLVIVVITDDKCSYSQ